jgi:putative membrane protein
MARAAHPLDAAVTRHRTTFAVVVPVVGAALMLASEAGALPPALAYHPLALLLGAAAMRVPLVAGLRPVVDRRAALAVAGVAGYAYAVEYVGVTTGVPYGAFHYGVSLGPMVAGVPVGLPVFFVPLVLNAYLLAVLLVPAGAGRAARVGAALATLLLVDATLDPAAVALGFWTYDAGGAYYGVPLSNYAGWVLSGLVSLLALEVGLDAAAVRSRLAACPFALDDLVSFTFLWGVVNVYYGNWVPALVTAALVGALVWVDRFDVAVPPAVRRRARGSR